MKQFKNMVSALVLGLGLTASHASFAEFFPPPMPMPITPIAPFAPMGQVGSFAIPTIGQTHGIYSPFSAPWGYGMYRYGYRFGYARGFLARGGCGYAYRHRHGLCGRGRRTFRSFSLNVGFGGFGLSINSLRF